MSTAESSILYFIFSPGSLRYTDVYRHESGSCRTLSFFLTFLNHFTFLGFHFKLKFGFKNIPDAVVRTEGEKGLHRIHMAVRHCRHLLPTKLMVFDVLVEAGVKDRSEPDLDGSQSHVSQADWLAPSPGRTHTAGPLARPPSV